MVWKRKPIDATGPQGVFKIPKIGSCDAWLGSPRAAFARTQSAEFLSNALQNFVRELWILHGPGQHDAADQCG